MNNFLDFGVQSWCFNRTKDNAQVAQIVRELGLSKIELCGVHADFHDIQTWKDVVKTYNSCGVKIVSLGVETLCGDEKERDVFECAAIAGAKQISVHFKVDSFPKAIAQAKKLSNEFGVKVGIHCHGGYMFGGQPDVLDHLVKLGAPEVGVYIDTAWCMQIGPHRGNPIEWVKHFSPYIYGVHLKDFTFEPNGQWHDTVVGKGSLDLPAFIAALKENGFAGEAILEYEGDFNNPLPALKECVASIREVTAAK
jgi:sugar phosphate isomerase/epimerase